ncbi:hypothetical protein I9018_24660 [Pseudomonas sp. MPFS]|uniref:hypothetical protein n=1 Tax=Pseudomonas sp. MPFS TaxID=2795724 RepID=UPI001F14898D|nr:hypothetical protein [Pseudomonas sp. MPFS]UMZ10650.1 hypothetical protein I9018_24660 [Pseudomonas sp. MPFS]
MHIEENEVDGFELSYSVQVDTQLLELLVDELESGDCYWQLTNACGQVLQRSNRYEDQALCLRDGLNNVLPPR